MVNLSQNCRPEMAFEVSWEVCNKVGGIHTVLASKAPEVISSLGDQYIVIGPDIWREERENPEFTEDSSLFSGWIEKALDSGLHVRTGRWNIKGNPIAIMVDFTPLFPRKNEIFSEAWESWSLDSISGQWDYVEAALFGYAAGQVISSFMGYYRNNRVLAHFHEWMTGMGVLYLQKNAPNISTAFTTHATVVGRSIAGNGMPLYSELSGFNGDEMAMNLGVRAKHSLEKNAAHAADCFATVSEITGRECAQLLDKTPDVITPNGFEPALVPPESELPEYHRNARSKLLTLAEAIVGYSMKNSDYLLLGTGGRYEFQNKGLDVFIKALGILNKKKSNGKKIAAFILVPANHYGPRKSVLNRLSGQSDDVVGSPYLSHNLHDVQDDPVINMLISEGIMNHESDNVKVFFIPSYLNGDDGILGLTYYEALMGLDLTVFPSYYEPWGYTPLESLAFGVPTVTSNLAGFGLWIKEKFPDLENKAVHVIDRQKQAGAEINNSLAKIIKDYTKYSEVLLESKRSEAIVTSGIAKWTELIAAYEEVYCIAFEKSGEHELPQWDLPSVSEDSGSLKQQKSNDPIWKNVIIESFLPEGLSGLNELARNLWWTWNYHAEELFESISPSLWAKFEHNPIKLLMQVPYDRLQILETDEEFMSNFNKVFEDFKLYKSEEPKHELPQIAYFSMEYGFHSSLKIYSGGLGILAGDYLKEASDRNYPLIGIGLLYRFGYFKQVLTVKGEQLSENVREEFSELAVHPVFDQDGNPLKLQLAFPGRIIRARIWKVAVGRISLYLLDTDLEENQSQDRTLTSNLYGGDEENRLQQEMLLGVGGIRTLAALGLKPDVYHCNEGHAAFIGFERIRRLMESKNFTFNESLEVVRGSTLFTTHTPVPAGHDAFHEDLIRTYMGHYPSRLKISWDEFMDLGKMYPGNRDEKFSMSNLAANLSQEINAVSNLHGEVTRKMFADLWKGYYPEELHIGYVTNGVHYQTWTAKVWQDLYLETFGKEFLDQQSNNQFWSKIFDVDDSRIWKIKEQQRDVLITYLKERLKTNSIRRHEAPSQIMEVMNALNPKVLTIGFARRFATYKRAHLLFMDLDRLAKIVNNPERPVQFLFAGKAHPKDGAGQDLIKYIVDISRKPEFRGRIVFLENYDMTLARHLVQGVDIWLNTPTRPLEASGTSGMKAALNGAMNLSVLDGWWCEGYREGAGWGLPEERIYDDQDYQDELDVGTLYGILEEEVVPLFYNRDENGIPVEWVSHIKKTIAWIAPNFTTKRMIDDYSERFYSVLSKRSKELKTGNHHLARELSRWKKNISKHWDNIELISIEYPEDLKSTIHLGNKYKADVVLDIDGLSPDDIGVELVVVEDKGDGRTEYVYVKEFTLISQEGSQVHYKLHTIPTHPGVYKFGIRVFPKNSKLPHRQDFSYVKWM